MRGEPLPVSFLERLISMETSKAILLRKRKLSDTSLIISWCTESLGCIETVARGARRPKSPFAGKLDLFFETEIEIKRSRRSQLHTLCEVVLENPFAGIREHYLRTEAAALFVEWLEIATEPEHPAPELFQLLRRALGFLDGHDPTARAVRHFETELSRLTGIHDDKQDREPAIVLAALFGRMPRSRPALLKALA